jgi:acyl-CoA thioester hydrolase
MTISAEFIWPVRVYYEDTDAGGVVFYANYLKFFERARTEWLRASGIGQQALSASHGVIFVVKSTSVDYHAPAKLDDELNVTVVVEKLGRASVQFVQEAWRSSDTGEELLTTGRIRVGCVDAAQFRPCAIPDDVLSKIKQLE